MNFIAITIGDINGIGIEIFINLWKLKTRNNLVSFSNQSLIKRFFKRKKIRLPINLINKNLNNFKYDYLNVYSYSAKNNEDNAYKALIHSYNLSKKGYNVSKYIPFGPIKEMIPYLIRRAEENSSIKGQSSRESRGLFLLRLFGKDLLTFFFLL